MRGAVRILVAGGLIFVAACGGRAQLPGAPAGSSRAASSATSPATARYAIVDLGTLGGSFSSARAINAGGEVTGASSRADGAFRAFTYTMAGGMTDIGSLGGSTAIGNGIDVYGDVAGYSTKADGTYHAFLYRDHTMKDIGDLGGGTATAYAINDARKVVGSSATSNGLNDPFLFNSGRIRDLGSLGGHSPGEWNNAAGINGSNVVVGVSYDAFGNFLGFRWSKGRMKSVGTLGGDWSVAQAVNAKGEITGQAYTAGNAQAHAFLWASGKMRDLGILPGGVGYSWGFGISLDATVVGRSEQPGSGSRYVDRAFVYRHGTMRDLNDLIPPNSGWVLNTAYAVNDSGQIVGDGTFRSQTHAFLLIPR
jgi:probable HAF family extracellular repeat protein